MLTGQRLFEGETISDTLVGVLTKEPEWEGVPANAQRLLKSCLEKAEGPNVRTFIQRLDYHLAHSGGRVAADSRRSA
jgi:hypothetical protein